MLAIRAARLFDGVGPDLVERPVVLVDEGSIVAVDSGAVPAGADVVDLGEATVLPGLIDAHRECQKFGLRREALLVRVEVRDLRRWPVAAGWCS